MLIACGACPTSIDWPALARHLAAPDIRRAETCLAGVTELPGGQRLRVERGTTSIDTLWSPWPFADRGRQIADDEDAVRRVRSAARHCVAARAEPFDHVLLKLSGGLDSSIVAAALVGAGRPFSCLTLVTEDASGDERGHARAVAAKLGVPLIERFRDVGGVRLEISAAHRLPRPSARGFTQESVRHATEVATEVGAGAIVDGGGGDNVFCSLQSIRPAVDSLLSADSNRAFMRISADIARLAQVSLWTVMRRALIARWRRLSAYSWPADHRFLSAEARRLSAGATDHPWLEAPAGTLPGKAAHVALVTAAQSVIEGADAEDEVPTLSPLISQPLVETCLQVPSWLWFEDGLNRAVARRAFASDLPREIAFRRSKGGPDSFIAEIFEANRPLMRDMLLGGALASNGLLDRAAVLSALSGGGPVRGHDFLRLMQLVDAEAWAQSWARR